MKLSRRQLSDLKAEHNLVEFVKPHTKLTKKGSRYTGCCPLHSETTPSFYCDKERFHCFGCGKSGDIFDFLKEAEKLSFKEVLAKLGIGEGSYIPTPLVHSLPEEYKTFEDRLEDCRNNCSLHFLAYSLVKERLGDLIDHISLRLFPLNPNQDELSFIGEIFRIDTSTEAGKWRALNIYESYAL